MVVVLPVSSSISLRPNNTHVKISNASSVPIARIAAAMPTTSYQAQRQLFDPLVKNNPSRHQNATDSFFQENFSFRHGKPKVGQGLLTKEVEHAIFRLEAIVERVRELETKKFMERVRVREDGTESYENQNIMLMAEATSKEIVSKFLERPIRYFKSHDGRLEDKLKDINLLIAMLERSCPRS